MIERFKACICFYQDVGAGAKERLFLLEPQLELEPRYFRISSAPDFAPNQKLVVCSLRFLARMSKLFSTIIALFLSLSFHTTQAQNAV